MPTVRENPQLEPSDHCYTILQDHGAADGGWGPLALSIAGSPPSPVFYTGNHEPTIARFKEMAETIHQLTGKPTRFVKFTAREDLEVYG